MRDRPAEPRPAEPSLDTRPCLGLIVLQVDETIEDDARRLFAPADARLHVTRVPSGKCSPIARIICRTKSLRLRRSLRRCRSKPPEARYSATAICVGVAVAIEEQSFGRKTS